MLAFLSGARWRIAHRYRSKRINTLSFLQNFRVPVDTSLHDFEQNLQLLRPLEINGNIIRKEMYLSLGPEEESGPFLRRHELEGKLLIGMHPGSSIDRGMIMKRWPIKHFSALCDWLSEQYGARVLLFGGPEEMPLREEVIKYSKSTPLNVSGLSFPATAALIRRCSLFITNDSGLMHVAVAAGTRTAALFGPTDPGRTAPVRRRARSYPARAQMQPLLVRSQPRRRECELHSPGECLHDADDCRICENGGEIVTGKRETEWLTDGGSIRTRPSSRRC